MLAIEKSVLQEIRLHGEETYPHECCGVLLGDIGTNAERIVTRSIRCGNTRSDSPETRYNIDPKELVSIQRRAREEELEILGFYHSHPDHPARWSSTDLAEAHWFDCSYVITSVTKGKAKATNSFLLTGDTEETKRLEDEPLQVIEPAACLS